MTTPNDTQVCLARRISQSARSYPLAALFIVLFMVGVIYAYKWQIYALGLTAVFLYLTYLCILSRSYFRTKNEWPEVKNSK